MPDQKPMPGLMRIAAKMNADGTSEVVTTLPNGWVFALGRDEMLQYAFAALAVTRNLFCSVEELEIAVAGAQGKYINLLDTESTQQPLPLQ